MIELKRRQRECNSLETTPRAPHKPPGLVALGASLSAQSSPINKSLGCAIRVSGASQSHAAGLIWANSFIITQPARQDYSASTHHLTNHYHSLPKGRPVGHFSRPNSQKVSPSERRAQLAGFLQLARWSFIVHRSGLKPFVREPAPAVRTLLVQECCQA
jgi:hypothetical protein